MRDSSWPYRYGFGYRPLRQLRRSHGRRTRKGASGHAASRRKQIIMPSGFPNPGAKRPSEEIAASQLRRGDAVLVEAGEVIPGDGEAIEGIASVDESAITGESAPVIRESGGDRSAVTGGTKVLSDWLIVRITAEPGRDISRPYDRLGRGRRPSEDTERNRAQHAPRRADHHFSVGRRHAARLLDICGPDRRPRRTGEHDNAHRAFWSA